MNKFLHRLYPAFFWFLLMPLFSAWSQAPNYAWVQQIGGTGRDLGIITASDATGNVYETGSFNGTVQLGPTTLTSAPRDMYVVKYNRQGSIQWARQGRVQNTVGAAAAEGISATTDAVGNVYVSGNFVGTLTFGTISLTANTGTSNAFVVKYDAQGVAQWALANNASGNNRTFATGLAVNANGEAFMSGAFFGSTTFGGFSALSQGGEDIFLVKISAQGVPQWVQSAGGAGYDYAGGVAIGPNNGVYLSGGCSAAAAFGSLLATNRGGTDAFLARYDGAGTAQWVQSYGGPNDEGAGPIAVASTGELYTTGYFQTTAIYGSLTLTTHGGDDGFILKCTSQGNPIWVNAIGGPGIDSAFGLALGANDEVYLSGIFNGTAAFGNQTRTSVGGSDIYVARYNSSGAIAWVTQCGGPGNEYDAGIAYGGSGAVYVGGQFTGIAQFGLLSLTSRGAEDGFVAQLQDNTPTATSPATAPVAQYNLFPNPAAVGTSVTFMPPDYVQELATIDLLDALGQRVQRVDVKQGQPAVQPISLDTQLLPPGIYFLKYTSHSAVIRKSFTIQ